MRVKVMKFGGTSMGSAEAMKQVIAIVRAQKDARVAGVVVSAMSGVTDQLIAIAQKAAAKDDSYKKLLNEFEKKHEDTLKRLVSKKNLPRARKSIRILLDSLGEVVRGVRLVKEISPRGLDYVMSYGERLSAHVLTEALLDRGVACEYLNARNVITTNNAFGSAIVDFKTTNAALRAHFNTHKKLQIVTGFIAATKDRATTTLGRGGSDYTAAIIGAGIGASVIEIWTDVSGVMTADPRKVKEARPVPWMTYHEAVELSYFGAKVIHPPTMQPALEKNIPILIKNTFEPAAPGTLIGRKARPTSELATGITSVSSVALLRVEGSGMASARGVSGRLFGALARAKVNVILITQASSQHSISIAVSPGDAEIAVEAIEEEFALERSAHIINEVIIEKEISIIAVVGEQLRRQHGIAGRLFGTLGKNGINVRAIAQGSSEFNISFAIDRKDEARALSALHEAFFFPNTSFVNIFLAGTGLIGGMLLKQIATQWHLLEAQWGYRIRVIAIGNHESMHFDRDGIDPHSWKTVLSRSEKKMDINAFVEEMKRLNLPGSVFVDCTASEDIAARYVDILSAGISVVTPNKVANSGPLSTYRELEKLGSGRGVKFLYETNVGAGLPVISTLQDLIVSGDKVLKIDAVLSGTLSHIFNVFKGKKRFSECVREAQKMGYTEPDPRIDLSGLDVARKILILARETGEQLELKDVRVESLLTPAMKRAKTVDDFYKVLEKSDKEFEEKKEKARKKGKVLRYIATLDKGKAKVSLEAVDDQHPFYALYGNDNVIAFFTRRYRKTPLIVQGPGAGAEVTAAGVFADILRTAKRA